MKIRHAATAMVALGAVALPVAAAPAAEDDGHNRQSIDTRADFSPFERFRPLASSSPCTGDPTTPKEASQPFVLPPGYVQDAFVNEITDPGNEGRLEDLFDMHTQNESGPDAGRYLFRTHEVGAAGQEDQEPSAPGGAGVSVTDLRTGETRMLIERNDWERFDGLAWTPWGTLLAAEETITQEARDPQAPQAKGGLVYEIFLDEDDPSRLDPAREPITAGDGTTDSTRDAVRARPALGAKSHEGMRFDRRGFHYGIAESRGETRANQGQSGAIYRFVPDRKGDLSEGTLFALRTSGGKFGEGTWIPLPDGAAEQDADAAAAAAGANRYERPEDVETGESTGKDRLNGQHTLYVAITDGAAEGVVAVDTSQPDRPFAYPYAGKAAGNATEPAFNSPDNLALDRDGNLAITEDPGGDAGSGKTAGDDVWIAAPPEGVDKGRNKRSPAESVARFASLKDCDAEPSGIYFALKGTQKWTAGGPFDGLVDDETLLVHRMHSGQGGVEDQSVAIRRAP